MRYETMTDILYGVELFLGLTTIFVAFGFIYWDQFFGD